jgi:hypothetical protein
MKMSWGNCSVKVSCSLSCRYSVAVARDNTVRLGARWLQIPPGPRGRSYAGCRVEVRELLDGRLLALYHGAVLAAQASPSAPSPSCPGGRRAPIAPAPARPRRPRRLTWLRSNDRTPPHLSTPRNRGSSCRAHPAVPRAITRGADPFAFMSSARHFEHGG